MPDAAFWQHLLPFAAAAIGGYLLGSLPVARWVANRKGVDPLLAGERNPGTANVWRMLGPVPGAIVLVGDVGKAAAAAVLGLGLGGWWAGCTGVIFAMAGHAWPAWSRFRGGRSVACLAGGAFVLGPLPGTLALAVFFACRRPIGLWRAAAAGLVCYPVLFFAIASDRWRIIGIGGAYLVLVAAWTGLARRSAVQA